VGVRPGVDGPQPQPPPATVGVGVGVGVRPGPAPGPAQPPAAALTCRAEDSVRPRGAVLVIHGTGFSPSTTVQIGGHNAAVRQVHAGHIQVEVPRETGGGLVVVTSNGQSINCGTVRLVGGGPR
jgi:hypothetical protein